MREGFVKGRGVYARRARREMLGFAQRSGAGRRPMEHDVNVGPDKFERVRTGC